MTWISHCNNMSTDNRFPITIYQSCNGILTQAISTGDQIKHSFSFALHHLFTWQVHLQLPSSHLFLQALTATTAARSSWTWQTTYGLYRMRQTSRFVKQGSQCIWVGDRRAAHEVLAHMSDGLLVFHSTLRHSCDVGVTVFPKLHLLFAAAVYLNHLQFLRNVSTIMHYTILR